MFHPQKSQRLVNLIMMNSHEFATKRSRKQQVVTTEEEMDQEIEQNSLHNDSLDDDIQKKTKLDAIQNVNNKSRKYLPLDQNPIENEFETPELLEKLHKTPVEEVKDRPKYTLGNYDSYYNYRYEKRWQDPRLRLLKKDYFLNKDCLDLGCNDGSLTIMIAIKFFPKKITGMDIDYKLINKAISNLKYFEKQQALTKTPPAQQNQQNQQKERAMEMRSEEKEKEIRIEDEKVKQLMEKLKKFPKSFSVSMGIPTNWGNNDIEKNKVLEAQTSKVIHEIKEEEKKEQNMAIEDSGRDTKENSNALHIINRFPNNIHFQVENCIRDVSIVEQYDTILCLSTTKWIHFNWGDCGIRRLFKKVYDALRPGGHFLLEPQDWRSYKKRKYLTKEFKEVYKNIELRPNNFENYLVQRLGFKKVTELEPDNEAVKIEGFKRSIYIFQKV